MAVRSRLSFRLFSLKKIWKAGYRCPDTIPPYNARTFRIVRAVLVTCGALSAVDLVSLSHREGGTWSLAYNPDCDNEIGVDLTLDSRDMEGAPNHSETAAGAVEKKFASIPDTFNLLRRS